MAISGIKAIGERSKRQWPPATAADENGQNKACFHSNSGQMAVEMAVLLPVVLIVAFIAVNTMGFLVECARFDPLAAEAVRIRAVSPNSGEYGSNSRAESVSSLLEQSFGGRKNISITVSVQGFSGSNGSYDSSPAGADADGGQGLALSLLPNLEVYTCTLHYRPWGFPQGIFGLRLFDVQHSRQLVIDPYRPGILF